MKRTGAASASERNQSQHQRHEFVSAIAALADRHLILLTATPHSGVESAFRSLLALLRPEFNAWDTASLTEPQRIELARHFVQRTRRDIERDWEGEHCFPKRASAHELYRLSPPTRNFLPGPTSFVRRSCAPESSWTNASSGSGTGAHWPCYAV
jgi:hypothetical protein